MILSNLHIVPTNNIFQFHRKPKKFCISCPCAICRCFLGENCKQYLHAVVNAVWLRKKESSSDQPKNFMQEKNLIWGGCESSYSSPAVILFITGSSIHLIGAETTLLPPSLMANVQNPHSSSSLDWFSGNDEPTSSQTHEARNEPLPAHYILQVHDSFLHRRAGVIRTIDLETLHRKRT